MLAYNCRSGPLAFTNTARLHLGYDGWYNKEKQVSTLCRMSTFAIVRGFWLVRAGTQARSLYRGTRQGWYARLLLLCV